MLSRLFDRLSAERNPSGYRPGVTLEHLRRNLGVAGWHLLDAQRARLTLGELVFEVRERTESQLFMHLVMSEFVLQVQGRSRCTGRYAVHHGGAIRRTGLHCRARGGDGQALADLQAALLHDAPLREALMPLDFKHLRLEVADGLWCLRLEHMGGSEVVNRLPAFRRYIALGAEQKACLFAALQAWRRILGEI